MSDPATFPSDRAILEPARAGQTVTLRLISPSRDLADLPALPDLPVSTTVGDVKGKVQRELTSRKYTGLGMRLIYRGRVLDVDQRTLGDVFGLATIEAAHTQTLHLVLRESGRPARQTIDSDAPTSSRSSTTAITPSNSTPSAVPNQTDTFFGRAQNGMASGNENAAVHSLYIRNQHQVQQQHQDLQQNLLQQRVLQQGQSHQLPAAEAVHHQLDPHRNVNLGVPRQTQPANIAYQGSIGGPIPVPMQTAANSDERLTAAEASQLFSGGPRPLNTDDALPGSGPQAAPRSDAFQPDSSTLESINWASRETGNAAQMVYVLLPPTGDQALLLQVNPVEPGAPLVPAQVNLAHGAAGTAHQNTQSMRQQQRRFVTHPVSRNTPSSRDEQLARALRQRIPHHVRLRPPSRSTRPGEMQDIQEPELSNVQLLEERARRARTNPPAIPPHPTGLPPQVHEQVLNNLRAVREQQQQRLLLQLRQAHERAHQVAYQQAQRMAHRQPHEQLQRQAQQQQQHELDHFQQQFQQHFQQNGQGFYGQPAGQNRPPTGPMHFANQQGNAAAGAQPHAGAALPQQPNIHRALRPNAGAGAVAALWQHIWLIARLFLFVWWFTAPTASWTRWATVILLAATMFVVNTGMLDGIANQVWAPVRQHLDGLLPGADGHQRRNEPGADEHEAPNNDSAETAASDRAGRPETAAPQPPTGSIGSASTAEPDPAEAAARMVRERRAANAARLRNVLRRLQRVAIMFFASLAPGVAERHVAMVEEDARAERRRQQEAVEAQAAEARAREEEAEGEHEEDQSEGQDAGLAEPAGETVGPGEQGQAPLID